MSIHRFYSIQIGFMILLAGLLNACGNKSEPSNDIVVAKAFDKVLYLAEIESLFGPNMTREDSVMIEKGYIDGWLRKQVLLHYAEKDGVGSSDDINKKVEDFRQDLLSFEYRKKIISEQLDTNISLQETEDYYDSHPENFELKQNIIRCVFIKMPIALENKHNYWNKFKKSGTEEYASIAIEALKNKGSAYMEKDVWLAFDDILKVVPINTYSQENFINNNRIFKIDEPDFVWFINILDFRIKENISPFEFVEKNIYQILLNKRKVELLNKFENDLVNKAGEDKEIEIYSTTIK